MPWSDYGHVPVVLHEVHCLAPKTVLELGIGFGKWGVLLREVLDARYGRCERDSWKAIIYGVDVHFKYANPCWDVYSDTWVGDFTKYWEYTPRRVYDLVMMMDSLEHLTPEVGRPFLEALVQNNKHVIIAVPNGEMPQGEVYGNPYEAHRWTFTGLSEFERFEGMKVLHQGVCTVVSIPGKGK